MEDLSCIMHTCVVLHNMIIEDERDSATHENLEHTTDEVPANDFAAFLSRYRDVHDARLHRQLQVDLVEHLWNNKGEEE